MSLLLLVLIILLVLNFAGGRTVSSYGSHPRYHFSWGVIIVIVLILYLLGYR